MQAIKCEICGSSDIVKQGGLFVCQYCGTKYSAEEVRKLLGTVRIDKSEDTENYLTLARRALNSSNYDKAEEYFELILRNDPNNLEAIFYQPFCNAMKTPLGSLQYGAGTFKQSLSSVFNTLGTYDQNDSLIISFTDLVFSNTLFYCSCISDAALNAFRANYKDPDSIDYCNALSNGLFEISNIYYGLEQVLKQRYPQNYSMLQRVQEEELSFYRDLGKYFMKAIPLMKEKNRLKSELK